MGDWMTVMIEGTCDPAEVAALTEFLEVVATVASVGDVTVGAPEREQLPPIPEEQMAVNFLKALNR